MNIIVLINHNANGILLMNYLIHLEIGKYTFVFSTRSEEDLFNKEFTNKMPNNNFNIQNQEESQQMTCDYLVECSKQTIDILFTYKISWRDAHNLPTNEKLYINIVDSIHPDVETYINYNLFIKMIVLKNPCDVIDYNSYIKDLYQSTLDIYIILVPGNVCLLNENLKPDVCDLFLQNNKIDLDKHCIHYFYYYHKMITELFPAVVQNIELNYIFPCINSHSQGEIIKSWYMFNLNCIIYRSYMIKRIACEPILHYGNLLYLTHKKNNEAPVE